MDFSHWILQLQDFCLVLFYDFSLFEKNSFCSYILFLISLYSLSEFSCKSLSLFITTILNSLSIKSHYFMPWNSVARKLSFSFVDAIFPLFFIFLVAVHTCFHIRSSRYSLTLYSLSVAEGVVLLLSEFLLCVHEGEPVLLFLLSFLAMFLSFYVFCGSYNSSG